MASSFFVSCRVVQMAAAVVVVLLATTAKAAVDQPTCMGPLSTLLPCQPYVQNQSSTPSPPCCSALSQVVQSQPLCLCAILDGQASSWLGFNIDLRRALMVPSDCLVQTPSLKQCLNVTRILPLSPEPSPSNPSGVSSDASFNIPHALFLGLLLAAASYVLIPIRF
uniref:Non-specific lipid-transfer protein-like protein At2g13820 n=1 Tax=Anthurium amnicola TaxID=1678845 RepID=A0A1D1ZI40_9ARAE